MKKAFCILLSLLLLISTATGYAEEETFHAEDGEEEILLFDDEEEAGDDLSEDDLWADVELVPYDYNDITIGNPNPLHGQFFTDLWGNDTSDIDVRYLVNGYNLVTWDTANSYFRFDYSVVSGAMVTDDEEGNRVYLMAISSDLYYSDGTPINARDYAFSALLQSSPLISELGGRPMNLDFLVGYKEYAAGETPFISGLRLISDNLIQFTVRADALPYFYEFSRLAFYPYPIHILAPGCAVYDDGEGAYIGSEDPAAEGSPFTADLLRQTILDPVTGYQIHPDPVSGPYRLISYDGQNAKFEINPYYKGNEDGKKPRIQRLTYTLANNDTMIQDLQEGKFALLNKTTLASAIAQGLALCAESPQYTRSTYPRIGLTYIFFNPESPLTQQLQLRQAVARCLDDDQFIADYVGPFGLKTDALYGLGQWMYSASVGAIPYPVHLPEDATAADIADFEKAQADWEKLNLEGLTRYPLDTAAANTLLNQAGWTLNEQGSPFTPGVDTMRARMADGSLQRLELTLGYPNDESLEQTFLTDFKDHLSEVGVSLTLVPLDFEAIVETHSTHQFDALDLIYLGDNFNISFDPALFFADASAAAQADADSLAAVYQELYALSLDMDRTEPGDILSYMKKWVLFQQRFSELLPLIPIYTNIYFDFYTRELTDYWIEENVSWAQAIVPARMRSIRTADDSIEAVTLELSYLNGNAELDLASLVTHPEHEEADYSAGALARFPAEVREQVPAEFRTINEFVAGILPEDIEDEPTITLSYTFQTPYAADEPVYVLFGIPGQGSDVDWIVQEGVGLADGRVNVVLEKAQWERLVGITFAIAVVSK